MANSESGKNLRILTAVFLLMMSALIAYEAFYSKKMPEITEASFQKAGSEQSGSPEGEGKDMMVNLNSAGPEELQTLSGVGAAMAERIISYRETHGGFASTEELKNVRGIGEKVFEKIKGNICV